MRFAQVQLQRRNRSRRPQEGVALLISIFILMLVSVVAIAMIVSSGTESSLAVNYRSSTAVYYAALAGLEEARGRLLGSDPNALATTDPGFLPAPGTAMPVGAPVYLINPNLAAGEVVAPWDPVSPYADKQFGAEFSVSGFAAPPNPSPSAFSVWDKSPLNGLPAPGPLFKWVRINAVSEKSLKLSISPLGAPPSIGPLYYDGVKFTIAPTAGSQVLEVTALAALPNGAHKILQYLVVPSPLGLNLTFPAALTLAGSSANGVAFSSPLGNFGFSVKGIDQDSVGSCSPGLPVHSMGVFDDPDITNVVSGGNGGMGIPPSLRPKFTGTVAAPDIYNVVSSGQFPANLQTPSQLDALAQSITQNADAVITPAPSYSAPYLGTATGYDLSSLGMSPSNPLTVVVNGNLDLNSWNNTGYGLLVVTGNLNYDPDASWYGIILVIGQGTVTGSKSGSGEIDGGVIVARTRDPNTNALLSGPTLGMASVLFDNQMQGNGIRYSSCWIQKVLNNQSKGAKILSFHEIAQP
jgi:hypothetical protein